MVTSPSDNDDPVPDGRSESIGPGELSITPTPDPETVAAITAAVRAHRRVIISADEETGEPPEDPWRAQLWSFAGRYEDITNKRVRPRPSLPANRWVAADRVDRI